MNQFIRVTSPVDREKTGFVEVSSIIAVVNLHDSNPAYPYAKCAIHMFDRTTIAVAETPDEVMDLLVAAGHAQEIRIAKKENA